MAFEQHQNAVLKKLRELFKERMKENLDYHAYHFTVSLEDEMTLNSLEAWEVGDKLCSEILTDGARAALETIYGLPVKWNAKKTDLVRNKAED